MKAIIYNSFSKNRRSEAIAKSFEGDVFEIRPNKRIKSTAMQMFFYGYATVFKKKMKYTIDEIDFDKYDEIVLVSPVWAGRINAYTRQFIVDHPFHDKKVTIIGSCDGGYANYFASFEAILTGNEIIDTIMYVKGELV